MATNGRARQGSEPEGFVASEPITLTDPDGAVTRVAPWSSWTREQVRRPGGESALVTRLDQGRLWFSSGSQKSPWLHEVHVGPAVVSTPGGRFQVSVEPDGGASVACLAGRARVAAGLEGPVVLETDQCAAVSSDGLTLVVLDRPQADVDVEDPLEHPPVVPGGLKSSDGDGEDVDGTDSREDTDRERRRWWVPELVAAMAVVAVVIAALAFFAGGGSSSDGDVAAPPTTRSRRTTSSLPLSTTTSTTTSAPSTTASTTTTTASTTTTTASTTTTTSSALRPVSPGASGVGVLQACRREPDGVRATVRVRHQSGAPSRFEVTIGAINRSDVVVAQAAATTGGLAPGSVGSVDVFIPVVTTTVTTCRVLDVASV